MKVYWRDNLKSFSTTDKSARTSIASLRQTCFETVSLVRNYLRPASVFPIPLRGSYPKAYLPLRGSGLFRLSAPASELTRSQTKKSPPTSSEGLRAPGGNRTRTRLSANRILSPARLPVPPPGQKTRIKKKFHRPKSIRLGGWNFKERKTRLEPATSTLAMLRSTN